MEPVLNALTMGFRPLWNAQRQLAGVQLFLHDDPDTVADTAHLLHMLREIWSPHAPQLLLSPQSPLLLQSLLTHATAHPLWAVEVDAQWLSTHTELHAQIAEAAQRGVRLLWRGSVRQWPGVQARGDYALGLLHLLPQEALRLMRDGAPAAPLQHQLFEEVHSQAVLHYCFAQNGIVAGWPEEDVLHRLRGSRVLHPSFDHVQHLLQAIEADQSLDSLEAILSEDPLLAYRLMLYANSAAVGARQPVTSLRRALALLGYSPLQTWLSAQLPQASHDVDLQPIRLRMVMRAQMTSHLLDAGISQELRSEVYLCGLLARLHDILDEPVDTTLTRLPLSERIADAIIHGQGPYAPSLQLALALEREDGGATIRSLCAEQGIALEHVNRSLLRLICEWPNQHSCW